ncbi:hypothetical protein ABZ714_29390 [Streptomyces sp. NPDC006798]|uniref:hypothetical protein n=1 Tax=Streptomyces sp. NPDC006798 TaxID=3155462 RepID=UPI0033DE8888
MADRYNDVEGRGAMTGKEIGRYEREARIPSSHTRAYLAMVFGVDQSLLDRAAAISRGRRREPSAPIMNGVGPDPCLTTRARLASLEARALAALGDRHGAVAELDRVVVDGGPVIVSTNGERDKHELDALWARAAGDVPGVAEGPSRISLSARFSLERAPGFLRPVFPESETIGLPGTTGVTDPAPVVAHLRSYRAWADRHDVPFDAAVNRARELAAERIGRDGAFTVTTHSGILVCRRRQGS